MDRSDIEEGLDDVPTDNIRQYILKHYGIDAEQEKKKKELKVGAAHLQGREVPHVRPEHRPADRIPAGHI